jgi:UDP-galactopyranose mutase
MIDFLIVGAGFAGSVVAERIANILGKRVLLIDKREHIGGNAYDLYTDTGILIHQYGPHIFHTNSQKVFDYLSQFTKWRSYEHRVKSCVDNKLLPIPINLDTVNLLYNLELSHDEVEDWFESVRVKRISIQNSEDNIISRVGYDIYERFFKGYTLKQWGIGAEKLDASVIARIPVRFNHDDRYFTDKFQYMPQDGYTQMFNDMLSHPKIDIMLNTSFESIRHKIKYKKLIYTGPIDEYYNYCFGKLAYRSIHFKFQYFNVPWRQPVAVINYPDINVPYTRSTEFKYLTGQSHSSTIIAYEYPCSIGEPYYPIPTGDNHTLYSQYKELAETETGVYFTGRLGCYRYYNMDQVVAQSLSLFDKISNNS